jgi:DNA-binding transcriptional regulator YdaS (Cro superfamily)
MRKLDLDAPERTGRPDAKQGRRGMGLRDKEAEISKLQAEISKLQAALTRQNEEANSRAVIFNLELQKARTEAKRANRELSALEGELSVLRATAASAVPKVEHERATARVLQPESQTAQLDIPWSEVATSVTAQQAELARAQADKKEVEATEVRFAEAASKRDLVGITLRQQTSVIGRFQRELAIRAQHLATAQADKKKAEGKILEPEHELRSMEVRFAEAAAQGFGRLILAPIHPGFARFIPRRIKQYIPRRVKQYIAVHADKRKAEDKILELEQGLRSMEIRFAKTASQHDSVRSILRQQTAVIGRLQRELAIRAQQADLATAQGSNKS